jgi:hypothetical protein
MQEGYIHEQLLRLDSSLVAELARRGVNGGGWARGAGLGYILAA